MDDCQKRSSYSFKLCFLRDIIASLHLTVKQYYRSRPGGASASGIAVSGSYPSVCSPSAVIFRVTPLSPYARRAKDDRP